MKALFGGIVGGVAAGSAWLAAEHFTQSNLFWMVILVGLITGLCVHWAGGSSKGWGTARGALALVLTMAVIVGGRQVYAKFLQTTIGATAKAQATTIAEQTPDEDSEDEAVDTEASAATPQTFDPESIERGPNRSRHQPSMKQIFSEWDMVWMSLAALAAYISGKGGEKTSLVESNEQSPEDLPEEKSTKQEEGQLK